MIVSLFEQDDGSCYYLSIACKQKGHFCLCVSFVVDLVVQIDEFVLFEVL